MLDPPPAVPEPRRSRAWLWTLLPVGLGLLVLLGGAVAGLVFALRSPGGAGTGPLGASTTTPVLPAPLPSPPTLAPPSIAGSAPAGDSDDSIPNALPPSARGARASAQEGSALFPVTSGSAVWGAADAPVTVALFGDLGCPHTRSALRACVRAAAHLGPQLRLVFYHRPLADRPFSLEAARVLSAVASRPSTDAAWRALNEASSGRGADRNEIERWLTVAGVETAPAALAAEPAAQARVQADLELGVVLDVQQTPTLFVNGRRLIGVPAPGTLDVLIEEEGRAVRFVRAQGVASAEAYARRVKKNLIGVDEGAPSRACVPIDKAPALGPPQALLTVVEFSDFECQHCRALEASLAAVMARHPGVVRRVWRSFALPQHENARKAAAFALAARELGGEAAFWAVHAALLAGPSDALEDVHLRALAARLGLDGARLLKAVDDPRRARELEQDHELASSLGLEGAPTLFINGRKVSGAVPAAALEDVVREELDAARRVERHGTPAARFESLLCGG
ncbi:MAG TPA: thioredoxin domain-containing protein [Polyangiaceae bacterium]|nr:thioredoxin domain-containing protein [Polyangiaceae bacterium]